MSTGSSFARFYDVVMTAADRFGLSRRRQWLARDARGRVLEIGAGTGLEFGYYPATASIVAIEPDTAMIERAKDRAAAASATVTLVVADAAALPFHDDTFDTAISALSFCTIPQPERAASEIRRVLRASGTARVLEHVRAKHQPLAAIQSALTPLWRRVAGGCHLDRRTADMIRRAGFDVFVERAAFDGAVVELIARPSNALQADRPRAGRSGSPQRAFSNAVQHEVMRSSEGR